MNKLILERFPFLDLPKGRGKIVLSRNNDVATLCLSNPKARNALSIRMMHQFLDVFEDLREDCPRILVLRGEQGHFCAGGDLRDVRDHLLSPEIGHQMSSFMNWVLQQIEQLECFIVVVIEGAAIGGGAELALIGDYLLMDEAAKFGFVQMTLGVTPGWGGATRLVQRVGAKKALKILTLSEVLSAQEAYESGLIDKVSMSLEESYGELVQQLLSKPGISMRNLGHWITHSEEENETELFAKNWASIEHMDALGLSKTARS